MMVTLTIKEMRLVVFGLFDDLVGPVFIFIFMTLSSLAALFALIRP